VLGFELECPVFLFFVRETNLENTKKHTRTLCVFLSWPKNFYEVHPLFLLKRLTTYLSNVGTVLGDA
jgi:hypothetical protein